MDANWPGPKKRKRILMGIGGVALSGAIILSALAVQTMRNDRIPSFDPPQSSEASGQIALSSDPPMAAILVDGKPTGLVTPAVLHSLRTDKSVKIRLEKVAYAPTEIDVLPSSERRTDRRVRLKRIGTVRFKVPKGIVLVVDGKTVDARMPLPLSAGPHEVRLMKDGQTVLVQSVLTNGEDETRSLNP
jgi:hypothetical protein